jgi:hypothetical protein
MSNDDVAAVFWAQLEAAARIKEETGQPINHAALQAYALAYIAAKLDDVRSALVDVSDRIDAHRGI